MSWNTYREIKTEYNSDDSIGEEQVGWCPEYQVANTMDPSQIQALIDNAVRSALSQQQSQINSITQEIQRLQVKTPAVVSYQKITVVPGVKCDIKLDIIKSVPDFSGAQDQYVAWRQAAIDAYELFKPFDGSSEHYQAVAILRNKVTGPAGALLISYNTVLNFDAILARLDCTYADRTSLRLLRQNLDMVRQGEMTLMQYYDEVEKRLTLVTNKIVMSHEQEGADLLNAEVRADALHSFISGLRKQLRAVVFPAQPKDLPSALALAIETEASIERSMFANSYAKVVEERSQTAENGKHKPYGKQNKNYKEDHGQDRNPHYKHKKNAPKEQPNKESQEPAPQPMEVDSSSKFRQRTEYNQNQPNESNATKRRNSSERQTGPRRQRLNNIVQTDSEEQKVAYEKAAKAAVEEIDSEEEYDQADSVHFLGNTPGYRSSNDGWLGEH